MNETNACLCITIQAPDRTCKGDGFTMIIDVDRQRAFLGRVEPKTLKWIVVSSISAIDLDYAPTTLLPLSFPVPTTLTTFPLRSPLLKGGIST